MKTIHPLILVCLVGFSISQAAEIVVAPNGSASGDGTQAHPLDLATALSSSTPARPGDTIWLRGGRYIGKFTSTLNGVSGAPITVRSYPGEWAVIDSGVAPENRASILMIRGSGCIYRDFEVMSSDPIRTSAYSGSWPSDIKRGEGIDVRAPNTQIINVIVHDAAQGIAVWSEAPNSEVYGCLIYHNGWQGPDRAHGHGIYSQNEEGYKLFRDNIIFNQFEKGVQIYGSSAASIKNFRVEGNTVFNNGILSVNGEISENLVIYGGATGPEAIVVRNNDFYGNSFAGKLLIGGDGAKDLIFEGNYVPHLTRIRYWQHAEVTANTFIRDTSMLELYTTQDPNTLPYVWNGNVYLAQELKYTPYGLFQKNPNGTTTGKGLLYDGWRQATMFDSASQYTKSKPSGTRIMVRPNAYENGRATITVYNWNRESTIAVDLGSVIQNGQPYEVRNAQNYLAGPILTGTYDGASVRLPASGLGIAQPVGIAGPSETGPEFNVYIVRATGPVPGANTEPTISQIPDQSVHQDTVAGPIAFSVADEQTSADRLAVLASSSNPTLVPNSNIRIAGDAGTRSVTVEPASGLTGTTSITVSVTDGSLVASTSFALSVTPVNTEPSIAPVGDVATDEDVALAPITLAISDRETDASDLRLWAMAADPALVPSENIRWGGTASNPTIEILPAPNANGATTISIVVSDGELVASTTFGLTVHPVNDYPTQTSIPDQQALAGVTLGPIPFTIGDPDKHASELLVRAYPSDASMIPQENILLGGSDESRTISVTPSPTASGRAKVYVIVTDGSKTDDQGFWVDIDSANTAPSISEVADQTIHEDTTTDILSFVISDVETEAANLTVSGHSSDPLLVPNENILFSGTDGNRSMMIVPAENAYGTAVITVTVSDGALAASTSFVLTVSPVNDHPTLSYIAPQITQAGATLVVPFTIGDAETPPDELRLKVRSSKPFIVGSSGLELGGSGANRTVAVTPWPNQYGKLKIYLTVTDGHKSEERGFYFTSAP